MAPQVQAGGNEIVNDTFFDWAFNMVLWYHAAGKLIFCNYVSLFGMLFWNDNGIMGARCLKTSVKGGRV